MRGSRFPPAHHGRILYPFFACKSRETPGDEFSHWPMLGTGFGVPSGFDGAALVLLGGAAGAGFVAADLFTTDRLLTLLGFRLPVESRNGAGARRSRFHSPLIEPDRPISGIRLSDRLHGKAHAGSPDRAQRWTPRTPKMVSVENRRVPRTPLDKWRRRRNDRTRCST